MISLSAPIPPVLAVRHAYLRLPPPPPRLKPPPPPRDLMLEEEPRLLPARAFDPLYPREPPPKASRLPPPLRERSLLPMRSAPPPPDLVPKPLPVARLLTRAPPPRVLARLPPCGQPVDGRSPAGWQENHRAPCPQTCLPSPLDMGHHHDAAGCVAIDHLPSAATNRLSRWAISCIPATNRLVRWPVSSADVAAVAITAIPATYVRIAVKVVVVIDVDVISTPAAAPTLPPLQNAPIITPTPKEIAIPAA
jgi:hypothetical protein